MYKSTLSRYFEGVAYKRLSSHEVDPETSHGHEFQGVQPFRALFGTDKQKFPATFVHLSETHEDYSLKQEGSLTWYDSRERQALRSAEYRLYYSGELTLIPEFAQSGDLFVLAKKADGSVLGIIAEGQSTCERQVRWLFGIPESVDSSLFEVREISGPLDRQMDLASQPILEILGVELREEAPDYAEELQRRFGSGFPKTREFSAFARESLEGVLSRDGPDEALVAWLEREELLFRTLERQILQNRLRIGFDDVDAFIELSLSVQNRRKSRAGHAFENHLERIFNDFELRYSRNAVTENFSKPDFLFPGVDEYRDPDFPDERLTMLGVKSTCKERWRQVLAEAARIQEKHLITLEPAISENQTAEMRANRLQLVLPRSLHSTFTPSQQRELLSVSDFLRLVGERQLR